MAINLSRRLASITELSTPKLVLSYIKSEPLIHSASRFMCSSAQQPQPNQADLSKERGEEVGEKLANENKKDEDDEEQEDDGDVNKVTREIGGPRGPEPTRYGDWERNGRCSDF